MQRLDLQQVFSVKEYLLDPFRGLLHSLKMQVIYTAQACRNQALSGAGLSEVREAAASRIDQHNELAFNKAKGFRRRNGTVKHSLDNFWLFRTRERLGLRD